MPEETIRGRTSAETTAAEGTGRSVWAPLGAVLAGVAASLCCILPALAAFAGVGSAAAARAFQPYRPWLIGLTAILLGWGWVQAFVRARAVECADGSCRLPASVRIRRWLVVGATVVATVAVTFPWWVTWILG
jgi:mercuric ion transport protein